MNVAANKKRAKVAALVLLPLEQFQQFRYFQQTHGRQFQSPVQQPASHQGTTTLANSRSWFRTDTFLFFPDRDG